MILIHVYILLKKFIDKNNKVIKKIYGYILWIYPIYLKIWSYERLNKIFEIIILQINGTKWIYDQSKNFLSLRLFKNYCISKENE